MKNYDIFVSYSTADKLFVHDIANCLKHIGLDIWLDAWEMLPGDRLRDKIFAGIANSRYLLIVLTDNSINSSWVQIELDSAMIKELELQKVVVIPVLYGNISHDSIPQDLKGKFWLDFNDPSSYNSNINLILKLFPGKSLHAPYEYEIVKGENIIELLDDKGKTALITKKKIIRILAETLTINHEEFYSDGLVDSFEVTPGAITSISHSLGKTEVVHSFGKEVHQGETIESTISCAYHNSFLNQKEYWITWQAYPNLISCYTIIFPTTRPPRNSRCSVKRGTYEFDYTKQPDIKFLRGKPTISCEVLSPTINDYHKVEWEW